MPIPRNPGIRNPNNNDDNRELRLPTLSDASQYKKPSRKGANSPSNGPKGAQGKSAPSNGSQPHTGRPDASQGDSEEDEWEIDPKTGVRYRALPKSEYDKDGNPILQVDIDPYDLQDDANRFLAHLRVPPNKAQKRKIAEKAKVIRERKEREYRKYQVYIEDKYGPDDDDEE